MHCTKCGATIAEEYLYCPHCGDKVGAELPAPPTPNMKKPMPFWFKLVTSLSVIALIIVTAGILFTEHLVDVIDDQLQALREHQIDKAYFDFTSKEFQRTTSFNQFKNFIEAYPVFENNQSAHFSQRSIEHNVATMKGQLTTQDHLKNPIEYKLTKEGGKWKILTIRLLKPSAIKNTKNPDLTGSLIDVVTGQLKEVQSHHLKEAYQHFSSNSFKEATPEKAFEDFINRYPILSHQYTASFQKPSIRNGIGSLSVILKSDTLTAYVKYYFIHEDQSWKIWSMRVVSPSEDR